VRAREGWVLRNNLNRSGLPCAACAPVRDYRLKIQPVKIPHRRARGLNPGFAAQSRSVQLDRISCPSPVDAANFCLHNTVMG